MIWREVREVSNRGARGRAPSTGWFQSGRKCHIAAGALDRCAVQVVRTMADRHPTRTHPVHPPPVARHNEPVVLFVTVCVNGRLKILASDDVHRVLRSVWQVAEQWHVGEYMIMPDHIHLFCVPGVMHPERINVWASYWKRLAGDDLSLLRGVFQRDCWDTDAEPRTLRGETGIHETESRSCGIGRES